MRIILTLLLVLLGTLKTVAQNAEQNNRWTDDSVLQDVSIGQTADTPTDILVNASNTEYTIKTAKGLAWVSMVTNERKIDGDIGIGQGYYPTEAGFKGCIVQLGVIEGGKLDISAYRWVPIGQYESEFKGHFNGNTQEITGLWIEEELGEGNTNCGLFGMTNGAVIESLGVQIKTFKIKRKNNASRANIFAGGIAGYTFYSKITKCYVYGVEGATIQVENMAYCCIGGLVGDLGTGDEIVTNCYTMIDIISKSNETNMIGGIIGYLDGLLSNSFATGRIEVNSSKEESRIGGLAGCCGTGQLMNNLALNIEGITFNGATGDKHTVGYVFGDMSERFINNYVSPNFPITGDGFTQNEDEEPKTIGTETDLAAILNTDNPGGNVWSFPKDGGLPFINEFGEGNQPTAFVNKEDYKIGGLVLSDESTTEINIDLKYMEGFGWWLMDNRNTQIKPFNGEISGTGITKGIEITVTPDTGAIPTLTIVDDLEITNNNGIGLQIIGPINLNVAEGKKVDITGSRGLEIMGLVNLNQPVNKSKDTDSGGITITGIRPCGILNYGTFNINVGKLTVKGKGNIDFGIFNHATININNGEVTVEQGIDGAIWNTKAFNLNKNATLSIFTNKGSETILDNWENATFAIQPGATFRSGVKGQPLPLAHTLTYPDPSKGTLSITHQNNIALPSGAKIGTGTKLIATVKDNTEAITAVTYTPSGGVTKEATPTENEGIYTFTMPVTATKVAVKFEFDDPDPIPNHTITLPEVEGATLNPGAGSHTVERGGTFRFFLTLDPEYNQSQPVVTTSSGQTLHPRLLDGAYEITQIKTSFSIAIDGIVKNPDPVANIPTNADAISIRSTEGGLLIHVPSPERATIYTFTGTLLRSLDLPAGDSRIALPAGSYIVRVGTKVQKVVL